MQLSLALRAAGVLGALAVLAGCGSSGGSPAGPLGPIGPIGPGATASSGQPAPAGGDATSRYGDYRGTMTIAVTTADECNAGHDQVQNFTYDATLHVGAPLSDGENTEANPFTFIFVGGDEHHSGNLALASALVATSSGEDVGGNPRNPNALLTYWSVRETGGHVDGTLTNENRDAAIYNQLFLDQLLVDCRPELGTKAAFALAVAQGATLTGTIGGGHAQLTFTGKSYDQSNQFTATFTS